MKKMWIKITILLIISALIKGFRLSESKAAGLLKPLNGTVMDIYLKSHHIDVVINNGFAKTEVDQIFINQSDQLLST